MTSVERIQQYGKLEQERGDPATEATPPSDWPKHGRIRFDNVSLSYTEDTNYALKDITIDINETEKVSRYNSIHSLTIVSLHLV